MRRRVVVAWCAGSVGLLGGCAAPTEAPVTTDADASAAAEVRAAETAFARSMADRDLAAFAASIADDAVFVNGGRPLRGKAAIVEHWKRFFVSPAAPFAWRPQHVETTAGGTLGYSEGPVFSPDGKQIATYWSTWRRVAPGRWLVVFDQGSGPCDCR